VFNLDTGHAGPLNVDRDLIEADAGRRRERPRCDRGAVASLSMAALVSASTAQSRSAHEVWRSAFLDVFI
jgi:hypothetical protein